ncbi:TIGR03085 family metal-binding protein [Rhizohabitans arisaemae]|uniref:TIGR03085 family metal-binding protein n=1 Tax=Rhizohabitans arisaemae TaxID=2720610 RepID=UPI0024B0E06A|nr:TIGR03085 family metal-binding protein [Rhizohabitans arisaemae]
MRKVSNVRAERAAICATLDRAGPDAPTLCGDWTTADLTAHLVLRERRPDAAGGIILKPLARYTESVQTGLKNGRPYPELVDLVRQGPPAWSPYAIPPVDAAVNAVELFVHHEDVRRAQPAWEPRDLPAAVQDDLWARLRRMARLCFRKAPVGVVLRRPEGDLVGARKAEPHVVVTGDPAELLLYAFGRQAHARVALHGDETSIALLNAASLGM